MDNALVEKLIEVLNKETDIYDDILKLSKNKTNVVVEGKVTELENIVKLEQTLVLKMGQLEGIREELIGKISAQLAIEPSKITLSELAKLLKADEAEGLKKVHTRLSGMLNELKTTNQLNTKLIKNSLDYIDFSLNLMTSTNVLTANNYSNSGTVGTAGKRSLFDVKL